MLLGYYKELIEKSVLFFADLKANGGYALKTPGSKASHKKIKNTYFFSASLQTIMKIYLRLSTRKFKRTLVRFFPQIPTFTIS